MVLFEEAIGERQQMDIKVAPHLILYFAGAVQDFHPRPPPEKGLREGKHACNPDNLEHPCAQARLEPIYGVFNEEGDCG
jgi:hypothetical protein